MRFVLGMLLVAGCASGTNSGLAGGDGGSGVQPDSGDRLDSALGQHDAHEPIDANIKMIDAAPDAHPDAPPDAHPDAHPDAPPDACVPLTTQLLLNPAFDLTPLGVDWTQVPFETGEDLIDGDGEVDSTPDSAWLGGIVSSGVGAYANDQIYQNIVIPADTTELVLTGKYLVQTDEDTSSTTAYDTGSVDLVQTDATPIENVLSLSNLNHGTTTFTAFTHTFTHLSAGMTVQLRFSSKNDFSNITDFFFDTLSLKATHCP